MDLSSVGELVEREPKAKVWLDEAHELVCSFLEEEGVDPIGTLEVDVVRLMAARIWIDTNGRHPEWDALDMQTAWEHLARVYVLAEPTAEAFGCLAWFYRRLVEAARMPEERVADTREMIDVLWSYEGSFKAPDAPAGPKCKRGADARPTEMVGVPFARPLRDT